METIEKNGIVYALLKADKCGYVKCPFCLQTHRHGRGGVEKIQHRIAHCDKSQIKFKKIGECEQERGYYVEFI